MIESHLRDGYQRVLVHPIANCLKHFVTPNQITLLSGLLGILVLPALVLQSSYIAVLLLLLSGFCDTLDGTLARVKQDSTVWGSVLDIMSDRTVECAVVLGLFAVAPTERALGCIGMLVSMLLCVSSFLVVGIFTANDSQKSFHYSPGLMERAEAFLFFIAMMLWPSAFGVLALLFILLVTLTAFMRLAQFYAFQKVGTHQ